MVYRLRRGDLDPARVGLSVGRRCGGAVARNRLKRRMRAACRQVELPAGVDLVLHAEPDATGLAFQEMVEAVQAGAGSP